MTTLALLLVSSEEIDCRNSFSSATLFVSTENVTMDLSSSAEEGKLPCVGVVGVEAAESAILESRLQWARCLASLHGIESMKPEFYLVLISIFNRVAYLLAMKVFPVPAGPLRMIRLCSSRSDT